MQSGKGAIFNGFPAVSTATTGPTAPDANPPLALLASERPPGEDSLDITGHDSPPGTFPRLFQANPRALAAPWLHRNLIRLVYTRPHGFRCSVVGISYVWPRVRDETPLSVAGISERRFGFLSDHHKPGLRGKARNHLPHPNHVLALSLVQRQRDGVGKTALKVRFFCTFSLAGRLS